MKAEHVENGEKREKTREVLLPGIEFLERVRLFKGQSPERLKNLWNSMKYMNCPPDQTVIEEGTSCDFMFIVASGSVDIKKWDPRLEISFLLRTLREGEHFGDLSILSGFPYPASLITREDTGLITLHKDDLNRLLENDPAFSSTLSRLLSERLYESYQNMGFQYLDLEKFDYDHRILKILPKKILLLHRILPLALFKNTLTIAMVNPRNIVAFDDVRRFIKGVIIEPVVITESDFERFMKSKFPEIVSMKGGEGSNGGDDSLIEDLGVRIKKDFSKKEEGELLNYRAIDITEGHESAPCIKLANSLLTLSIKKGASDIHVEPQEKGLALRIRKDGFLHLVQYLPSEVVSPLISRFKIMAGMNISEKRLPQDGRISIKYEEQGIDFRVSTVPSKYGEKMVLRVLERTKAKLGLDKLINHRESLELFRDMINQPYGIIYVTGPTGSGKTTTLYSALSELNTIDVNILTVEDPIEYDLPGITQVEIKREIDLDFARTLRAFLRQDPDIILIGETRDIETAKISIEAALTGHLVFSTLHANNASSTFVRLIEMGIDPILISNSIIGVVAQRLVRRLCPACKVEYTPEYYITEYLMMDESFRELPLYRAKGCEACGGSGFRGRMGIYEILRVTDRIKELVANRAPALEIEKATSQEGMLTLSDYGKILLKEGETTVEEILHVVAL